jgi:type I restriction enzyme S subunit
VSELPRGWTTAEIRQLCTLENGRAFKPSDWTEHGLPIVRIQNLNRQGASFNHFAGEVDDRYRLRGGELLFAWSGTPGTSFGAHVWRGGDAVLNQHIFRVDFDGAIVEKRFFRHAINQKLEELIDVAHGGVGLRHVTKGVFESTEVLVPPLPEQKRIADKLDALLARVDASRERLDRVPGILKRFRQSVLAAATSGELTREWREERGLDGEWPVVDLDSVASDFSYGSAAKSSKVGKVPVLRMGNIQDGLLDWEDLVFTSDAAEIFKYRLSNGDGLFNRTNSPELVGKTAVFRGERDAIYAGYLIRVRCGERLLPDYLNYCLGSPAGREYCWQVKSDGVSQSNINARKLAAFTFGLPSVEEQHEIIRLVEELLGLHRTVGTKSRRARVLVDRLTLSALGKAFRGELVPQDPRDEPASELLTKLRAAQSRAAAEPPRRRPKTSGKRPAMSKTEKDAIKAAILKLKTDRFSPDELRAQVSGDYESFKAALFELLEEPNPVVRQVFDMKAKAMQLVRVRP